MPAHADDDLVGSGRACGRHVRIVAWLGLPVLILAPPLLARDEWYAAVAGFLAFGITLSGALAFGRRWWPPYLLIASVVLLLQLLTPDAYTAFGMAFDVVAIGVVAGALFGSSRKRPATSAAFAVRPDRDTLLILKVLDRCWTVLEDLFTWC